MRNTAVENLFYSDLSVVFECSAKLLALLKSATSGLLQLAEYKQQQHKMAIKAECCSVNNSFIV